MPQASGRTRIYAGVRIPSLGCGIFFLHNLTLLKAYPLEFKNKISWNLLHDTYLFVLQLAKIKVGLIC